MVSMAVPIGPSVWRASVRLRNPIPPRSQLVDDGEHMLGVAPEAVELPHGEDVALAEVIEASVKLWLAGRRAADAMVGEDARRPGFLKRVELKLGILKVVPTRRRP